MGTDETDEARGCTEGEGEGVRLKDGGGASSRSIVLFFEGIAGARGKGGRLAGQSGALDCRLPLSLIDIEAIWSVTD